MTEERYTLPLFFSFFLSFFLFFLSFLSFLPCLGSETDFGSWIFQVPKDHLLPSDGITGIIDGCADVAETERKSSRPEDERWHWTRNKWTSNRLNRCLLISQEAAGLSNSYPIDMKLMAPLLWFFFFWFSLLFSFFFFFFFSICLIFLSLKVFSISWWILSGFDWKANCCEEEAVVVDFDWFHRPWEMLPGFSELLWDSFGVCWVDSEPRGRGKIPAVSSLWFLSDSRGRLLRQVWRIFSCSAESNRRKWAATSVGPNLMNKSIKA